MNRKKSLIFTALLIFLAAILVNVVYNFAIRNNEPTPVEAAYPDSDFDENGLDNIREELEGYVDEIDDANLRLGYYLIELLDAEERLRIALRQYSQADTDLGNAIARYKNEIEMISRQVSRYEAELDTLNQRYEAAKAINGELAQSLRIELDSTNASISAANATIAEYNSAINDTRQQHEPHLQNYRNTIEELVDAQLSLEDDIAQFRDDIMSNQAYISGLVAQIDELENDVATTRDEVEIIYDLIQTRDALVVYVDEILGEIDQAFDTLAELRGHTEYE